MFKNIAYSILFNLLLVGTFFGQTAENPVVWEITSKSLDNQEFEIKIEAKLFDGFHTYSQTLSGDEGPVPTEVHFSTENSFELIGKAEEIGIESHFDPVWELDIAQFSGKATFIQKVKQLNPDSTLVKGFVYFMACNESMCFPPEYYDFEIDLASGTQKEKKILTKDDIKIDSAAFEIFPKLQNMDLNHPINSNCDISASETKEGSNGDENNDSNEEQDSESYWILFFFGLAGGLVSLITPCVFPMIPLTVSFFTKGGSEKGKGVAKAILYGVSIIAVYVSLSIPFYFGAESEILSQISTSFGLNIFFFAIFLFFAFSFFGYYELTLPSSWANKADKAADLGGFLGVVFMALVLAIVSFSCTGPLLGSVLAGSLKDGAVPITMAMLGFGVGLGLPFTLFAAFPSMLKSLPQSGGWLNTVKVVLGFVELALALKFLSNADLVYRYGIVYRETFFLIWFVVAIATALYLFGAFKFPHDSPNQSIGKSRKVIGAIFLSFGIYLAPGIFSKDYQPWSYGLISGFPPPTWYSWYTSDASKIEGISLEIKDDNLKNEAESISDLHQLIDFIEDNNKDSIRIEYHITDYYVGREYAQYVDRPMLIDFTGYACVNCRRMEENVWTQPKIKEYLERDYIVVSLYVDDKQELPKDKQVTIPIENPDGTFREKKIITTGDRWANFSIIKFGQIAQPYYALLSPDEYLLNNPVPYTPNVDEYESWLECGLNAFDKLKSNEVDVSDIEGGKNVSTEEIKPVTWSFSSTKTGADEVTLNLDGKLGEGWHTYSQYLSSMDGPLPTLITFEPSDAYELIDSTTEENTHTHFDETFEMEITDFNSDAIFKQKIKVKTGEKFVVKGNINFMVCEEGRCLPPEDQTFEIEVNP